MRPTRCAGCDAKLWWWHDVRVFRGAYFHPRCNQSYLQGSTDAIIQTVAKQAEAHRNAGRNGGIDPSSTA